MQDDPKDNGEETTEVVVQPKEPMLQLLEAMNKVMKRVEYLKKDDTVGTGASAYKGISDEKVKNEVRKACTELGLIIVPTIIQPNMRIDRWEEPDQYKPTVIKQKQQVFSEALCTFTIYHISGASITGMSYGHGVDSQDKGPGKAMTYAMKNFILNSFMIPTGEDSDKTHSDEIEVAKVKGAGLDKKKDKLPTLEDVRKNLWGGNGTLTPVAFDGAVANWMSNGGILLYKNYIYTVKDKKTNYFMLDDQQVKKLNPKSTHG